MIEKHIVLEDIDPVIFYGINNANMQMIKALFPKLRIVARGNVIKVMGDEEEMCAFEEAILDLEKHCAQYNSLNEEAILDIIKGNKPAVEKTGDAIVYSVTGKPITPRSANQLKLVKEFEKNDVGQNVYGHCSCRTGIEEQGNQENHLEPSGGRSRRKAGLPSRRHERQNRPLPATTLRCLARHDSGG